MSLYNLLSALANLMASNSGLDSSSAKSAGVLHTQARSLPQLGFSSMCERTERYKAIIVIRLHQNVKFSETSPTKCYLSEDFVFLTQHFTHELVSITETSPTKCYLSEDFVFLTQHFTHELVSITNPGCPAHRLARKIGKKDFFTRKNRRKIGKYYRKKGGKQEHNSLIWNSKLLSYDGLPSPLQLSQSPPFYLKKYLQKIEKTAYKMSMYQTPVTRITVLVAIRQCMILDDHKESTNIFFVQHSTTECLHYEFSKVGYTMIIFFTNSTHWLIFATKRTGLKIHNHILLWNEATVTNHYYYYFFFHNRR